MEEWKAAGGEKHQLGLLMVQSSLLEKLAPDPALVSIAAAEAVATTLLLLLLPPLPVMVLEVDEADELLLK